jgi:hypothetical protein
MVLNPAIILSRVVFPHPEGPRSVKNSPSLIFRDKSGITTELSSKRFKACFMEIVTLTVPPGYQINIPLKFTNVNKPFHKLLILSKSEFTFIII